MAQATKQRVRRQPERTCRLEYPDHEGLPARLVLTVDGEETAYLLGRVTTDWGLGFRLAKCVLRDDENGDGVEITEAEYDVLVPHQGPARCDCMGHERWGHCKHADAVSAMVKAGKL